MKNGLQPRSGWGAYFLCTGHVPLSVDVVKGNRMEEVTMIRSSGTAQRNEPTRNRLLTWERVGVFYARVALGCAFLSAVADRFGLWGKYGGWGNFANFTRYTAQVNSSCRGHCPFSRVDGHCRGDIVRDSPDIRVVAEMGGTRQRRPTCYVWDSNGDFFRSQVAVRLFGIFCFRRGFTVGPTRLRAR
jgi:hypothetical protein